MFRSSIFATSCEFTIELGFCYTPTMPTTTQLQPANNVNFKQRQTLVLRVWESVSTERELQGVLEAVTQVLLPVAPYDSVAIIWFDGVNHDPYAAHIVGAPRRTGETLEEYFNRPEFKVPREIPVRPLVPYDPIVLMHVNGGAVYACNDVFAKETWYEHDFHLAAGGVRAYTSIPLIVRGKMIGAAVFNRKEPIGFTTGELAILQDASRALAVAVANALANEE